MTPVRQREGKNLHLGRPLLAMAAGLLVLASSPAGAQQSAAVPPLPPLPTEPLAIPNPHYVTVALETTVNRPVAAVWARVGKFCDIAEWYQTTCRLLAGRGNELGSVRLVRDAVVEMLVGRTPYSYTYAMPVRVGVPYNAFHGTLEARPISTRTTKLIYSGFYDNSMLADDKAREEEIANRRVRWTRMLANMKTVAEGGKLPPAPLPVPAAR